MKKCMVLMLALLLILTAGCSLFEEKAADLQSTTGENTVTGRDAGGISPDMTAGTDTTQNAVEEFIQPSTALNKSGIPVTLYYRDADGYLIPVTRWIGKQQGIARAAVSGLIDSAITREDIQYYGVYPVLPENTDILGINIINGVAVIDFNRKVLGYADAVSERDVVASIVYTLTEFRTVDSVRILVNGYPQETLKFGTDISGLLSRDSFMVNTRDGIFNTVAVKADVYCFRKANEEFTYLLPVSVECGTAIDNTSPETLVGLLLSEKTGDALQTEMPHRARLLNCKADEETLILDFDAGFVDYGGSAKEEGILKQLLYTVRQLEDIKMVKILIEGKNAELPEGTDISGGLAVPRTINDVIDR